MKFKPDSFRCVSNRTEIVVGAGNGEVVFGEEDIKKFVQMAILPASRSKSLASILITCGYAALQNFPEELELRLKAFSSGG